MIGAINKTDTKNLKDKNFVHDVVNPITHIKGLTIESLKPQDFTKAVNHMNNCNLEY